MAGSVRARSFAVSGASYEENYTIDPLFGNSKENMLYQCSYIGNANPKTPSSAVPDSTRQASACVRAMPLAVSELVTVIQSVPASSMR